MIRSSIRSSVEDTRTRLIADDYEGKTVDYKRSQRINEHEQGGNISRKKDKKLEQRLLVL